MNVGVIGGGGWGTTLAMLLASGGHTVRLWVYEPDLAERMRTERENAPYLPGVPIPAEIGITGSLADAASGAEALVLVTPSHALRATTERLLREAPAAGSGEHAWIAVGTKGLERGTLLRMSEVLGQVLPERAARGVCILAGPSHAEEVARRVPTAVVAASRDMEVARGVQTAFSTDWFRVYTNDDLPGVEIAVAFKNVIAIAAGICDGLGFGDSTKGALLTRGLVEMARLGSRLGARPETFSGLAGMGDLIATAMSRHSRNRALGEAVGRGKTLAQALATTTMVVEGVGTADAVVALARRHGVEVPIAEQVYAILYEGKSPKAAIRELLTRDLKAEPRSFAGR
jgi:glycerol-3-phosphate dehydrogenase (NAD(P)+)